MKRLWLSLLFFQACGQDYAVTNLNPNGQPLNGGGDPNVNTDTSGLTSDNFAVQVDGKKIDILFVVDNSGSMADKQSTLKNSLASFIQQFTAKNVDFHIGIVSTDNMSDPSHWTSNTYSGIDNGGAGTFLTKHGNARILTRSLSDAEIIREFQQNVELGTTGSGSETGLLSITNALSVANVTGYNKGFLREDAALAMIMVSDEDESTDPDSADNSRYIRAYPDLKAKRVKDLTDRLNFLKSNRPDLLRFDAIVAKSVKDCPSLNTDGVEYGTGDVYMEIAKQFHGTVANICQDFSLPLVNIGEDIANGVERHFNLKSSVKDASTLKVYLNDQPLSQSATNGFTYDSKLNQVIVNGLGLETMRSFKLRVAYQNK